ncbi:MAG: hypothetical protein FWC85_01070 [Elusimicrobia bacterium]|nr:hypothetical protein [Elusimicrobiota bacterium]
MPFDGNGQFKRKYSWQDDKNNGIKILADRHDDEDDNIALGLSQCLTRDAQSSPLTDYNWGNNKIINLREGTNAKDAVNLSQLQENYMFAEDISPAQNIVNILISPNITSFSNGMTFFVKINNTNTKGTVTLRVNTKEALPVVNSDGNALQEGWLVKGRIYRFTYYFDGIAAKFFAEVPADLRLSNILEVGKEMFAKTDLSNTLENIDYIVETWRNGSSWYRRYKSGWIEQGERGLVANFSGNRNFILPFLEIPFVTITGISARNAYNWASNIFPNFISATGFTISGALAQGVSWGWQAQGMGE